MAEYGVNIDTVYQTVQALANKEQRGYVTPQEFNLFANQAQLDIFEQYFYDLNAQKANRPESNEIGDSIGMIRGKLKPWTHVTTVSGTGVLPADARVGRIWRGSGGNMTQPREIEPGELQNYLGSTWHADGSKNESFFWREPISATNGEQRIHFHPSGGSVEYVKGRPGLVYWGYVIVNEQAIYDPSTSSHFELHSSEQPDIVIKILELAGISIEDSQLLQYASGEEQQNIADERI
tara:strand:+ start:984 stop:1691 length:708 start_codon:yes stop_codon:yes gene_type:complete